MQRTFAMTLKITQAGADAGVAAEAAVAGKHQQHQQQQLLLGSSSMAISASDSLSLGLSMRIRISISKNVVSRGCSSSTTDGSDVRCHDDDDSRVDLSIDVDGTG